MNIFKKMTEFIESIPKEKWHLNTSFQNGLPSFSISTKHNGVTIDVRIKDTMSEFCFRVCFLIFDQHTMNHTTVMENFKSDKILEIYSDITSNAEEDGLIQIGNILFPKLKK